MSNQKHHSLTTYLISKLNGTRKAKGILAFLFCGSVIFLSYQFFGYSTLSNLQSQEYHRRLLQRESGSGHPFSLKRIALKFEERAAHGGQGNRKGDTGPLVEPPRKGPTKALGLELILGVPPEARKYYLRHKGRNFFQCLTSGKQISWDKVNDDFCDCPSDGSDEPSTAACMNGRFFCGIVKEGFPEYVPSSFVNDG